MTRRNSKKNKIKKAIPSESSLRSGFEATVQRLLTRHGVIFQYEPFTLDYVLERSYLPDFVIQGPDFVIEAKGYFKASDRTKMLSVKKAHPEIDLRLWFQRDNYLTKAKKKKYSDWAKDNGFLCHVGPTFPAEWFPNG